MIYEIDSQKYALIHNISNDRYVCNSTDLRINKKFNEFINNNLVIVLSKLLDVYANNRYNEFKLFKYISVVMDIKILIDIYKINSPTCLKITISIIDKFNIVEPISSYIFKKLNC